MRRPARLTHRLTLAAMTALGIWGLLLAAFPLQPFWIDEWRFIFNLKFLPRESLWGPMRYTQQCPRLYLYALKALAEPFQYSYTALRLPGLLCSVASMLLAWRLMRRLFPDKEDWLRPLFVLIIISSQTFTTYLVQAKHYEAEVFLALVALWQCLELEGIASSNVRSRLRYVVLCASLIAAPFFSYTYPIAIAPALMPALVSVLKQWKPARKTALSLLLPLVLSGAGIAGFYLTDVRQLMYDGAMHRYWAYRMATGGVGQRLQNIWYFFAAVGPGAVFEIIFGILGICGFGYGLRLAFGKGVPDDSRRGMAAYAVLLVILTMLLAVSGRLPAGEAKFSAFCVPALALLIVNLLRRLKGRFRMWPAAIGVLLVVDLIGNIISVIYHFHTAPEYARRMRIYRATQAAIAQAQTLNAPILITPGVAWPDEIVHPVPFLENMPADAIIKTWPAYDAHRGLPVYAIPDTMKTEHLFLTSFRRVITGDGERYRIVRNRR